MFTEPEYSPTERGSRDRRLIVALLLGPAAIALTCLVLVAAATAPLFPSGHYPFKFPIRGMTCPLPPPTLETSQRRSRWHGRP